MIKRWLSAIGWLDYKGDLDISEIGVDLAILGVVTACVVLMAVLAS